MELEVRVAVSQGSLQHVFFVARLCPCPSSMHILFNFIMDYFKLEDMPAPNLTFKGQKVNMLDRVSLYLDLTHWQDGVPGENNFGFIELDKNPSGEVDKDVFMFKQETKYPDWTDRDLRKEYME